MGVRMDRPTNSLDQETSPTEINQSVYQPNNMSKKPNSKKKIILIIVAGLFIVFACWFVFFRKPNQEQSAQNPNSNSTTNQNPQNIRLVATGDMIPHDSLNAAAKQGDTYDYFQFMDNMQPYFMAADIRFCNQAVLGGGEQFGISGYPVFNSPVEFAKDMNKVGCNLINTGSNHTNDLSQDVISASVAVWDDLDTLGFAGANRSEEEKNQIDYFEIKGVKFAFLSYTTYTNKPGKNSYGLTTYDAQTAKKQIKTAKQNADIVIVSMRWGTEYSPDINSAQETQSQQLADYGANIVLGHGTHVLEPVKVLKGNSGNQTYVWYSLGNFLNAQLEAESLVNGFAVMDINPETKEVSITGYLPTYMHYEWTAEQKAAEDLLSRKNFEMFLLEDSADYINKSQLSTTTEEQQTRITDTLNKYTNVPILSGQDYLNQ